MTGRFVSLATALGALAGAPLAAQEAASAEPNYEADGQRIMDGLHATGMTAAVLKDGKAVYLGQFGTLEYGSDKPVTEDTLFPIASISKAFTTTALAMLVDEGKLDWDDPVRKYIPEFQMSDPWVTEHFTVRDALTHRSGLPLGAGDLTIWPDGNSTPDDVVASLKYLRPSTGFRDGYAYDNLMYIVAGEIVRRVSGQSWTDFITQRIFRPLDMGCAADESLLPQDRPHVTGHERAAADSHGTPIDERMTFSATWNAAGGIWCSAPDMLKWGQFWLDGGKTPDGTRLLSEKQAKALWTGVTPVSSTIDPATGKGSIALYGLGWFLTEYEGTAMVYHSGGAPGVTSNFIILPEKEAVIFASSNDYMSTAGAWTRQVADALADGKQDTDTVGKAIEASTKANAEAVAAVDKAVAPPKDAKKPTLPLDAYTGTYRDPWYGTVTISRRGKGLFIDMGRSELLDGPLTHFDGDVFAAIWPDRTMKADAFLTFTVENGKATGMKMKAISDITDFSYDFHDLDLKRVD